MQLYIFWRIIMWLLTNNLQEGYFPHLRTEPSSDHVYSRSRLIRGIMTSAFATASIAERFAKQEIPKNTIPYFFNMERITVKHSDNIERGAYNLGLEADSTYEALWGLLGEKSSWRPPLNLLLEKSTFIIYISNNDDMIVDDSRSIMIFVRYSYVSDESCRTENRVGIDTEIIVRF